MITRRRCRFVGAAVILAFVGAGLPASAFEGFGYLTIGGQGGSTCHVTNLNHSGAGSLLSCATRTTPRIVVFDVGGTIVLGDTIRINSPFLTIDGTTAPAPGITIRPSDTDPGADSALIVENTHDVILRGLRIVGYNTGGDADLVALDGTDGTEVYNVVLDHLTLSNADDGAADMTGNVHDVTMSWCLLYESSLTSLIKYDVRQRISLHHNVYVHNVERNPQVKGDMRTLDFRNNIVYDWSSLPRPGFDGYGLRLWSGNAASDSPGEPKVNIVGNAFIAKSPNTDCGIDLMEDSGTHVQRWMADNFSIPSPLCVASNLAGPLTIPAGAQVNIAPSSLLALEVLPGVGMEFRNATENALLAEIRTKLPVPPDRIFNDGFESGDLSAWSASAANLGV